MSVVGSNSTLRRSLPSREIFASVGDAGRKSDGAAAMTRTSASPKRSRTAASSSAVVSTGTAVAGSGERHVRRHQRHVRASAGGLLG